MFDNSGFRVYVSIYVREGHVFDGESRRNLKFKTGVEINGLK